MEHHNHANRVSFLKSQNYNTKFERQIYYPLTINITAHIDSK